MPDTHGLDPGGRDGCRAPIPWDARPGHGWGDRPPWLPWPPDAAQRNVETMRSDPEAILHLYRRLLAARRASPALRLGAWSLLAAPDGVLAYERRREEDVRVVLVNFSARHVECPLAGAWWVEVASNGRGEGHPYSGTLGTEQALVLRRPGAGA